MSEFSNSEIQSIRDFLLNTLGGKTDRITRDEVYDSIGGTVAPNLTKAQFVVALSEAINGGNLPGIIISKGRYGGIKLAKNEAKPARTFGSAAGSIKIEEDFDDPEIEAPPPEVKEILRPQTVITWNKVEKPRHRLTLNGAVYDAPISIGEIKALLDNVIEAKEDPAGPIVLDDNSRYTCSPEAYPYLDRFLFFYFGAAKEV